MSKEPRNGGDGKAAPPHFGEIFHLPMIILAVGMPRAGSGWHYNLTHDLMLTAGATDAREIRRRYHLERILTEVNCNIGVLSLRRLLWVLIPSLLGHTFVIKLHAGRTPFGDWLIRRGQLRPTYIYRDPRDALLSAYEYGQRALARGRPNAFSHLTSIEEAIQFMLEYVQYWEEWTALPQCHTLRYEDLHRAYDQEAKRLARFLGLHPQDPSVTAVLDRYRPEQARPTDAGLHFHKGLPGRFRQALTPEQQQACLQAFGDTLPKMGYHP